MWGILFLKTSEFRWNHLLSNYDISTNNWAIHNGNLTLKILVIRTNVPPLYISVIPSDGPPFNYFKRRLTEGTMKLTSHFWVLQLF